MTTALRPRRRSRAKTAVASLAVAAGLVAGLATAAGATSEAEFLGANGHNSQDVHGTIDGRHIELRAGLFDLKIDGDVDSQAYCIDIHTPIRRGATLDEIDWDTSGVENLAKVEAILRHYHPNGDGPEGHKITGSDNEKGAATQAAIWHYTDGFDLDDDDDNSDTLIANYNKILEAVEGGLEGFGEPAVTLTLTPPATTEGQTDSLVGPYVVNTTADGATLTPSDGITLHNEDGSAFTGEVVDGTQVWLKSGVAGEGTITADAAAEIGAGRVFFAEGVQRLVLASKVTTDASAEASVSFTTAPTTSEAPTTTEAPSTTVPTTPDTTEAPAPTTTTTVAENSGGGLPVTGAQTLVLVGVAAVLLAVGVGFKVMSRRKELEG